jgi:hypothetical protein
MTMFRELLSFVGRVRAKEESEVSAGVQEDEQGWRLNPFNLP